MEIFLTESCSFISGNLQIYTTPGWHLDRTLVLQCRLQAQLDVSPHFFPCHFLFLLGKSFIYLPHSFQGWTHFLRGGKSITVKCLWLVPCDDCILDYTKQYRRWMKHLGRWIRYTWMGWLSLAAPIKLTQTENIFQQWDVWWIEKGLDDGGHGYWLRLKRVVSQLKRVVGEITDLSTQTLHDLV